MNEVLGLGLVGRDCKDFAGGGRRDGRHPGCYDRPYHGVLPFCLAGGGGSRQGRLLL